MFGATFIAFLATLIYCCTALSTHAYERLLDIGFIAVTSFTALCVGAYSPSIPVPRRLCITAESAIETLVDTMNEGLVSQDARGIITYVNDRFCAHAGLCAGGAPGPAARPAGDRTVQAALAQ